MSEAAVEILCWGVRNMQSYQMFAVSCPYVEFELGGELVRSEPMPDANHCPNFKSPLLHMRVVRYSRLHSYEFSLCTVRAALHRVR